MQNETLSLQEGTNNQFTLKHTEVGLKARDQCVGHIIIQIKRVYCAAQYQQQYVCFSKKTKANKQCDDDIVIYFSSLSVYAVNPSLPVYSSCCVSSQLNRKGDGIQGRKHRRNKNKLTVYSSQTRLYHHVPTTHLQQSKHGNATLLVKIHLD